MTPQEIRNLRLKNDYTEMVNIRGPIVSWKALRGTAPFIDEYEVTINVRGITGEGPRYRESHVIVVKLPANYPSSAPDVRMMTKPFVFHPNWYRDGKWCFGTWLISEGLGHHIVRLMRTIQYDVEITNEHSAANGDANRWYQSNRQRGIFPCDSQLLPDPTKKRMTINASGRKRFDIN